MRLALKDLHTEYEFMEIGCH